MATISDLDTEILKSKIHPAYCFVGEEEYLKGLYIRKIAGAFLGTNVEHGLEVVYGSETDAKDIIDRAQSLGIFAEKRALVVREVDALSPQSRKILLEHLGSEPSPDVCLVLSSFKLDAKTAFYQELQERTVFVSFDSLKSESLVNWVMAKAKELGCRISLASAQLLIQITGQSLGLLEQELLKISTFLEGRPDREIKPDHIKMLAGDTSEVGGFELAEALAKKDLKQSLALFHKMLRTGEDPVKMLSGINHKFNTLWRVKLMLSQGLSPEAMGRKMRIHPYALKMAIPAAQKRTEKEYWTLFNGLFTTELKLKSGFGDPRTVLQQAIFKLSS
ncbi:DNA polymerase III subunit delta [candidate division TA06 bacterium]|uniref:DNA polymerase III subunit delta n=1 Tax=candidate division TA06 bacterium TaxID=2250710 RepID=A0A933I9A5_UNCT6|nr:DNA polymerase III subunit delta [candidate division TA06 bacterium]